MINEELKMNNQEVKQDIQVYKEILTDTLKFQLVSSIKAEETEIIDAIKNIASKGEQSLTIYFVPEHIYKSTFVFEGDYAEFSLEHCIDEYIYAEKFFGKKQIRYTSINYKKFYKNLWSRVNINELTLLNEILNDNLFIKVELKSYFESLGLSFSMRPHKYFLAIDLSF